MSIQVIKEKYIIFRADKTSEEKFRKELSNLIIKTFGNKKYSVEETTEIISFSLNYYIEKFREICINETSVRFYQNIFKFHEKSVEIVYKFSDERADPNSEIDFNYIAKYRRILKLLVVHY